MANGEDEAPAQTQLFEQAAPSVSRSPSQSPNVTPLPKQNMTSVSGSPRSSISRKVSHNGHEATTSIPSKCLHPGVIVISTDARPSYRNDIGTKLEDTFRTPDGQLYFRRSRYWYVTSVGENHYNEHTICTY